jgi:hypothetical protein
MENRNQILDGYASDKKKDFEKLKRAACEVLGGDERTNKTIEYILEKAFRYGRYVGHIQGEKFQSDLLDSYKQALYEVER